MSATRRLGGLRAPDFVARTIADPIPDNEVFRKLLLYTPLLWLLGALSIAGIVVLFRAVLRSWPRGRATNTVVFAWLAIGVAQAGCSIFNGILQEDLGLGLRNALSFSVLGWIFGGLAIAMGAAWNLAGPKPAQWVGYLGLYTLGLAAIALVAWSLIGDDLIFPTPILAVFPNSNVARFYASIVLLHKEETLGESVVRLCLFYPWPPALGIGSACIALIVTRARDWRWRAPAAMGGLVGVVFSFSRLALGAGLAIALLLIFARLKRWMQWFAVFAIAATLWLLRIEGLDIVTLLTDAREAADSARAGSSFARQLIYDKSWQGFLDSPWIGNGWIGESVHRIESLPIGSHSTVFGLLYTGGIVTFGCFCAAALLTGAALLRCFLRARGDARDDALVGVALFVFLLACCPYESLFSLTLPCLWVFAWLGGCLAILGPPGTPVTIQRLRSSGARLDPVPIRIRSSTSLSSPEESL
jgi:hypothetical protein